MHAGIKRKPCLQKGASDFFFGNLFRYLTKTS